MTMTPPLRKFGLLTHIAFSVGWFGAVIPYVALSIAALTSHDAQLVRSAYISMELIGWYVIVPLSFGALLTGLVQSLGTQWGLFRHWWIVTKFALTVLAIVILLQHMRGVSRLAMLAKDTGFSPADLRPELIHSGGGLLVLLAIMVLSVFKPWGMTAYGRSKATHVELAEQRSQRTREKAEPAGATGRPLWARVAWIHAVHAIAVVLLFIVVHHISNGGLRHH
jgi:hypothetical protein